MTTKILKTELDEAAAILRGGGLVAVPTETVYGLAANGLDLEAVRKIYEVKGRPAIKPLSLMVPGAEAMERYCEKVPVAAKRLAARFWPGPLTIVLKARDCVPDIVLAGGDTVGLRCPDHPMTLALLHKAGIPFAAPSANPSGEPSPKTAEQVLCYFDGQIEAVLDGGACGIGVESTLISLAQTPYRILRQGALSGEIIADALVDGMAILGLTGGSGAGKTTALRVLEELGALVLDADAVYHELLESDADMLSAISARFPGTVTESGLDRAALGAVVFSDATALNDLNAITHAFISKEIQHRLREHAMAGGRIAAIDAIELIGSGLSERCTATFAVLADRETRIRRVMARDGITRERAERRIDAQRPDDYFVKYCDSVLVNDGTEHAFAESCRQKFLEVLKPWMN